MITVAAGFHGAFFVLLFEALQAPVTVERLFQQGTGYYLLEGRVPIYLKHSNKRKGPWTFNFFRSHQEAQQSLCLAYGECFTCMICGRDGIAGLNMLELRQVLDGNFEEQECVSVRRKLNGMYQIKGRDGMLENRISRQSIFEKLRTALLEEEVL